MNLLFEIPDIFIVAVLVIIFLIIAILAIVIKASSRKVKPIGEEDRYDNDEFSDIIIDNDEKTDEQIEAASELEKVFNQMSVDLEKQKEETNDIDDFEREQEENAIISYQELLEHAEKLKQEASKYEKIAEAKAGTKLGDAINSINKRELKDEKVKEKTKKKAFRSSDIVSPIYGIQSNKNMVRQKKSSKLKKDGIISGAYDQKRFDVEETQNLDFLKSLKEFRKNL